MQRQYAYVRACVPHACIYVWKPFMIYEHTIYARGRKHSNAVCTIGRHLREPDDARRHPTIPDRCLHIRAAHPAYVRSDIVGEAERFRRLFLSSYKNTVHGLRPLRREHSRRPDVSNYFEGAPWDNSTRSNGDVLLGDVASAANFKNIAEAQNPASQVRLHHTTSAAAGHPVGALAYIQLRHDARVTPYTTEMEFRAEHICSIKLRL
ncbi:hypothetical protein EVAR_53833_1 [Eumeta japonica]|uniref:Uncharacterized protein n=1 Tax=Eumeta variegata TaxID=151549 RepID=A0A4C1ZCH0_EUMVA|nr:hypothetical protein EVAR_53833_1 [Eumeta japonica]